MNTLLDLAGSYIIGGLVLLAIVGFMLSFTSRSQENQLNEITQRSVVEIGDIIEHDIKKLGYRVSSGDKILSISQNSIFFLSDIDNNGTTDTISYSVEILKNKSYLKKRIGKPVNSEWIHPIESFWVSGLDSLGKKVNDPDEVESIFLELKIKQVSMKNSGSEIIAVWNRKIYPKNL
jgi:hypothetical protein